MLGVDNERLCNKELGRVIIQINGVGRNSIMENNEV